MFLTVKSCLLTCLFAGLLTDIRFLSYKNQLKLGRTHFVHMWENMIENPLLCLMAGAI